jgi:hypothetical protein
VSTVIVAAISFSNIARIKRAGNTSQLEHMFDSRHQCTTRANSPPIMMLRRTSARRHQQLSRVA